MCRIKWFVAKRLAERRTGGRKTKMILVIEDDETTRELTARILRLAGHTVVTAIDGREALTILEQNRPSLIFTDLKMPGMDGWTFCRIQGSPAWATIPFVIVSAVMNLEHEGHVLGATGTISKPADIGDILQYATDYDSLNPLGDSCRTNSM